MRHKNPVLDSCHLMYETTSPSSRTAERENVEHPHPCVYDLVGATMVKRPELSADEDPSRRAGRSEAGHLLFALAIQFSHLLQAGLGLSSCCYPRLPSRS